MIGLHVIQDYYSPWLLDPFITEMLHAVPQPHRVQGLAGHVLVGRLHVTVKDLDVGGYIMMSGGHATSWMVRMDFPMPKNQTAACKRDAHIGGGGGGVR